MRARAYTDAEIDAAIAGAERPGAPRGGAAAGRAPRRRSSSASSTRRSTAADWFGSAHQAEVLKAAGKPDPDERLTAVRTLVAEETRLSMLVGRRRRVRAGARTHANGRLNRWSIRFLGQSASS